MINDILGENKNKIWTLKILYNNDLNHRKCVTMGINNVLRILTSAILTFGLGGCIVVDHSHWHHEDWHHHGPEAAVYVH